VATSFAEGLKRACYIMVVVPAVRAKSLVDSIVPYREDGKTIIKWSGNVSVLLFANILEEKGAKKDIIVAEAHTLP